MRSRAIALLGVAVLAVSWGAPLVRLTRAEPLAIAMWRMLLATALIVPLAAVRGCLTAAPERRRAALLAGLFLAAHFGLWIPSLLLTSAAASLVLVTTGPLWVLLASPRFLGVPIGARNLASFALALAGVAIITWGDFHLSWRALLGDAMALGGAVGVAGYMVVGKRVRGSVPLECYLALVYGVAGVTLALAVAGLGVPPLPLDAVSWWPLLGMAVGPTLIGHTLLNWALAHLEAYRVNLAVLLEPVLASFWVWLLLDEAPPLHVVPGAALIIAALVLEYLPAPARAGPPGDSRQSTVDS